MSTQSTPHCAVNTSALTPEPLLELFGQCVRAGDLDGLVALYAPDAVFIPSPGAPVLTGRDAIRNALAGLLGLKPTMNFKVRQTLMVGDTAKILIEWTMTGIAPDGSLVQDGGYSADVFRRQPDGRWLILIDHPHGGSKPGVGEAQVNPGH